MPIPRRTAAVLACALGALGVVAPATRVSARPGPCSAGGVATASGALDAPSREFRVARREPGGARAAVGDLAIEITTRPLTWTLRRHGTVVAEEAPGGLFVHARGASAAPVPVSHAELVTVDRCGLGLGLRFGSLASARLEVRAHADDTASFTLTITSTRRNGRRIARWGDTLLTPAAERIYGLTERIVADRLASERQPQAVGSLDRKGEVVTMYVTPTISAYVPFYQSSRRYGLLVDGTMPGRFDVGATTPDRLRIDFELDPTAAAARWFVFTGRDHYALNDAFSRLTGRPFLPPEYVFTHWVGHDEHPAGAAGTFGGLTVNALVADDLQHYEELGIPAGVYHFDRPWALGSEGFGELRFDPSRFPNAAPMLALLRARGWHTDVWFSEWLLDARLARAKRHGWLAPDSGREVDVTDRGAVRSVESDLRRFLRGPEGRYVDGLFVDRTDEIVPSAASSIYDDGRNGRQMHNAYPPEFQSILARVVRAERRARGWLIARAAYTGTPRWAMTWGGDTASRQQSAIVPEQPDTGPSTDLGLRSVLISLQRAAFMGIPYWGSDIGGYSSFIDRDLFARWIEVGAASPLMRFHGKGPRSPWAMPTDPADDPEMLTIYRRYITLHHRLAPTLHELAAQSHRTGAPIVRPLAYDHPEDPRAQNLIDEWKIGPDLLAAPVWQTGVRSRVVHLPAGTWVDFWDRTRTLTGPAEVDETVPLDRLPLYVRSGSPLLGMPAPP